MILGADVMPARAAILAARLRLTKTAMMIITRTAKEMDIGRIQLKLDVRVS